MTLAAMLCTQHISDTISQAEPGLLMHGPTFMGNPLACRVALASVDLLLQQDWQQLVKHIEQTLTAQLGKLKGQAGVSDVRVLGAIGVIELERSDLGPLIQDLAVKQGVWVRPFGKLVYTMPAYNIPQEQLETLCQGLVSAASEALK